MARVLPGIPCRALAGTVFWKTSAVYRKTLILSGLICGTRFVPATRRHTSRVMEAPEPPAMEETTSTMGAISMAGAVPTPGTRRATSSAARRESGWPMTSTAWRTASWISFSLVRMTSRPIPRYWPAPMFSGTVTSSGLRGSQVAISRSPVEDCAWTSPTRASSTTR